MKKRLRNLGVLLLILSLLLSGNIGVLQAQAMSAGSLNTAVFQNSQKESGSEENLPAEGENGGESEEPYDSISLLQIEDYSKSSVTFSWFSDGNNEGFFIYRKCKYDETYKKLGTVENVPYATHYFQDDSFVPGILFTYKIVAYRTDSEGNVIEGQAVLEDIQVGIAKVNLSSVNRSGKKVTIKWKKAEGVSGYEIFGKTGNSAYKKVATVFDAATVKCVLNNVSTSKKTSYKVRAFVSYNDNVVYGAFGSLKAVYSVAVQKIVNKFKKLQKQYPTGKYWNHVNKGNYNSTTITNKPCQHISLDDISTCNYYFCPNGILGYQCYGFAWKMSDLIYGKNAKIKKFKSFDKCKMGDVIRYKGHSVIITEKHKNYVVVGECNYGNTCMIMWGRKVYKSDLKKATYSRRYY